MDHHKRDSASKRKYVGFGAAMLGVMLLAAVALIAQAPSAPRAVTVVAATADVDPTTWRGAVTLVWDAVPDAVLYRVHVRSAVYVAPFYYEVREPRFGSWAPLPGGSRGETPIPDDTVFWFAVSAVNLAYEEGPRSPEVRTVYRTP